MDSYLHLLAGPLVVLVLVSAREYSANTIFKKTSEVIITRSKWMITLVIDLQPYEELLARLEMGIVKFDSARTQVAQDYLQNEEYCRIMYPLAQESLILDRQWKDMSLYLKWVQLLQTRKKTILPIVGKALSVLF